MALLTEQDIYLFREGTHASLHNKLGCHLSPTGKGADFAVWAPNARAISVIGDWNGWRRGADPLHPRWDHSGIWEGHVAGIERGHAYKYALSNIHGHAEDRIHGRADFVAHGGQKPALRLVGRVGSLFGGSQISLSLLTLLEQQLAIVDIGARAEPAHDGGLSIP